MTVRVGDPFEGCPEQAPFDSIIVKVSVDPVPQTLIDQLAVGGTLLAPLGRDNEVQELQVPVKRVDGSVKRTGVA